MNQKPVEKIRIGLLSKDKKLEAELKQGVEQAGGGYIYSANGHLELLQKLQMQRVHLIFFDARLPEVRDQLQSLIHLFRQKHDFQTMPIGVFHDEGHLVLKALIADCRVRSINSATGAFLGIMNLMPMVNEPKGAFSETIANEWIQAEFLAALKAKIGEKVSFEAGQPSEEELHSGFLCQVSEEVRSHLAWFKLGARILENDSAGFAEMFQGFSKDEAEAFAENLLRLVIKDFQSKLDAELSFRGAFYFPEIESLPPGDRKILYAKSKPSAFVFRSSHISVLFELTRYL